LLAASAPAFAKTESVTGKVIDMTCYMKDKANNAGMDHKMPADTKDCAAACAKKGQPLALLTSDGKVYEIAGGLAENNNAITDPAHHPYRDGHRQLDDPCTRCIPGVKDAISHEQLGGEIFRVRWNGEVGSCPGSNQDESWTTATSRLVTCPLS
jgi:hypothetical protein